MKTILQPKTWMISLLILIFGTLSGAVLGQSATVGNPLAIGAANCNGGGTKGYKAFTYDSTTKKLSQLGFNCTPSLASPGFSPTGGSIAFSPKDQKVYYITTTTGNNSIVYSWTPNVCPILNQAPIYTLPQFILGLEFDPLTGDGYFLEFGPTAPYNVYMRKVSSFSPLVTGAAVPITFSSGKRVYQQNGDIVITPLGKMYFALDNKMFKMDYSTYGTGVLNATYLDTMSVGSGNNVIGISYVGGNFVASIQGSACSYKQLDITPATGLTTLQNVALTGSPFTAFDMATMVTGIGVAKKLSSVNSTGANTYTLTYDIKVKSFGNVDLTAVQVTDNLAAVFGSAFVSATVAALGPIPATLTVNPLYNGNTNNNLFSAGGSMKAFPVDSAVVQVTVNLNNPLLTTTYYNTAVGTATGTIFANNVRDSSNDNSMLNPDPSGTTVPDLPGEGAPTPFNLSLFLLLPSKIIDFAASVSNDNVLFNWKLGNEVAGNMVYVEQSFDGQKFEQIGLIHGVGAGDNAYHFSYYIPSQNIAYYRIRVVDKTGVPRYSAIRKLNFNYNYDVNLTVGPNPFQSNITLGMKLKTQTFVNYRIMDQSSRVVRSGTLSAHAGENSLDISDIASLTGGVYVIDIEVNKEHFIKKIVRK